GGAIGLTAGGGAGGAGRWEPIPPWTPSGADLGAFAGRYSSDELDTVWRLSAEDGRLFIRHRGLPEAPLQPTVTDVFSLEGMTLRFVRGPSRAVTGFTLDDGRVLGIAFEREPAGR